MAFKSLDQYNEERFSGFFRLINNGDSANVIFLYQSSKDIMVATAHYLKSTDYTGYVQCTGTGCPVCAVTRTQDKLFIPLYNIDAQEIQFWDRNIRFQTQLYNDVLKNYPNPSEIVFKITRHGAAGDMNTTYSIQAVGRNTSMPYSKILADANVSFPDYYNEVCKDFDNIKLASLLNPSQSSSLQDFNAVPRNDYVAPPVLSEANNLDFELPETAIDENIVEDGVDF